MQDAVRATFQKLANEIRSVDTRHSNEAIDGLNSTLKTLPKILGILRA